jgi:hypothetical protein
MQRLCLKLCMQGLPLGVKEGVLDVGETLDVFIRHVRMHQLHSTLMREVRLVL